MAGTEAHGQEMRGTGGNKQGRCSWRVGGRRTAVSDEGRKVGLDHKHPSRPK